MPPMRWAVSRSPTRWAGPAGDRFRTGAVPRVIFTDPEVAHVGLSEAEAADRGGRVAYLPMSEVDRAVVAEETLGFVKLVAGPRRLLRNAGGGRVLGATIVCARAGEMIHEPALAMRTGMSAGRLARTVHAYPTWSVAAPKPLRSSSCQTGGRKAIPARLRRRTTREADFTLEALERVR